MIRAKVTAVSASRDDALRYLTNTITHEDWSEWSRAGDIILTQRRAAFKTPTWLAAVMMQRDEVTA